MSKGTCVVQGCARTVYVVSVAMCNLHYRRKQRHGDPTVVLRNSGGAGPHTVDMTVRLARSMVYAHATGCWLWDGAIEPNGYVRFHVRTGDPGRPRRRVLVHRAAYEHFVGPIPPGLQLDHLCGVRHCFNPAHLEPVTAWENTMRSTAWGALNAAKTHCPQGHPYDEANTLVSGGRRRCRACGRAAARNRRKNK